MTTTLTFGDEELSTVTENYVKKQRDIYSRVYRYADRMLKGSEMDDGGEKTIISWKEQRHSVTTQLTTGYEPVNLTAQPFGKPGVIDLFICVRPMLIGYRDEIVNRGKEAYIDRANERHNDTIMGLHEEFESQCLQGTQPNMSDLNSINGDDVADGFIEGVAVGSQNNVVHGLNKATYATLPGAQNQFYAAGGSFAAGGQIGADQIALYANELNQAAQLYGYCTKTFAQHYWRAVQPMSRYGTDPVADAGKGHSKIEFEIAGIKTCIVNAMPTAGVATGASASTQWSWLVQDHNSVKFRGRKGNVLRFWPWESMQGAGTLAKVGYVSLAGQNAIDYWGTSGVLVGANSW